MNDTEIKGEIKKITISKTKSGFIVLESAEEGYEREIHGCTDNMQVNSIVSEWTHQQQYN